MAEAASRNADEISLFALGTILLRNRMRIARWAIIGGVVAALSVLGKPRLYQASASFVTQGSDEGRSALIGLAGQVGIQVPTGNQSQSPGFYAKLITSPVLLRRIAHDTVVVREMGGKRIALLDLFEIPPGDPAQREEQAVASLGDLVSSSIDRTTGMVTLEVVTKWPSVSLAIATALLNGINDFNLRTRQSQGAEERKFVEGRLAAARGELRQAEDRLEQFLRTNRQLTGLPEIRSQNPPQLKLEQERLQRDVALQVQVVTALTQSYEEARIREVRDTPVITVVESPTVPFAAKPRGRIKRGLLGLVGGAFFGMLLAFLTEITARRRQKGDSEVNEFVSAMGEVRGEMLRPVQRLRERMRS
jgi:uncharacterized protein involved in exopolysaccharide biosynthesis